MGGLFSAPKPVIVQPLVPTSAQLATPPAAVTSSPEDVASQNRIRAQQAASLGIQGTIGTSATGALLPQATLAALGRKTLLGE